MLYRKAAIVGVGVGLLLAIAVAAIDHIMAARLAWQISACPDPRCMRMVQIVDSEPMHVVIAFALGFVAAFAWPCAVAVCVTSEDSIEGAPGRHTLMPACFGAMVPVLAVIVASPALPSRNSDGHAPSRWRST